MDLSRRDFLKATGIGGISLALSSLGFDFKEAKAAAHTFKLEGAREFTSICHFCACGCGVIGYVKDGKLINLEGATDSPINRGALCSKGLGYAVIPNSKERATKPLYRAPGSDHWEEISWDEAIDRAAKAMKNAREKGWKQTEEIDGETYESAARTACPSSAVRRSTTRNATRTSRWPVHSALSTSTTRPASAMPTRRRPWALPSAAVP